VENGTEQEESRQVDRKGSQKPQFLFLRSSFLPLSLSACIKGIRTLEREA